MINDEDKVVGVFGIGSGQFSMRVGIENIFPMINKRQIDFLLRAPKYYIKSGNIQTCLTRREAACLLYTMKGKTAKQTANEMNIKTRTTEDCLNILKAKLGCYSKSELISIGYESNLLSELQKFEAPDLTFIIEYMAKMTFLDEKENYIFIRG